MVYYGLEVGTTIKYIGLDAGPSDEMQNLLERVEQAAESESDFRISFLNEIVIDENDDGSYAVNMYFIEWGPFIKDIEIDGEVEIINELPIQSVSGTVDEFVGDKFGEKLYLSV